MNQPLTASIDLAQLDSLEALARAATPGQWAYQEESDAYTHIIRPVASPGWIIASATQTSKPEGEANGRWIAAANPATMLQLIALARSLTSGVPAVNGDALYAAWHKVGADVAGLRFDEFIAALPAPVHGAAAPSAEQVKCPECKGTGGVHQAGDCTDCNGKGYDWEPVEAGAAAKTDHAPSVAVRMVNRTTGATAIWNVPKHVIEQAEQAEASAAGAGSEQAPECSRCGGTQSVSDPKGWQFERVPCPACQASVTVQDERAPITPWERRINWDSNVRAHYLTVQEAMAGEIADLRAALAHPVQDGEKDAARYRWLCESFGVTHFPCALERLLSRDQVGSYIADGKESIDAAIDAAMAAAQQDAKGGAQ